MILGLDLGQAQDFTAIVFLSRGADGVVLVEDTMRVPLKTSYHAVVDYVAQLWGSPEFAGSELVVDATGVGAPVVELLKARRIAPLHAVTITTGDRVAWNHDHGRWHVAKKHLVSLLAVRLQNGTLQIRADVPDYQLLVSELQNFRMKVHASGAASYEAWREQEHDDLVLATALAVWWADKTQPREKPTKDAKTTFLETHAKKLAKQWRHDALLGRTRR